MEGERVLYPWERGFLLKKCVRLRTLAPDRCYVSSHLPLRGVCLLSEHFDLTGNDVSC